MTRLVGNNTTKTMKRNCFLACMLFWLTLDCHGQSQALYPIQSNAGWGYSDARGIEVIPPKFDSAGVFFGNRAVVKLGGKFGFIDHSGSLVIAPKWDQLKDEFRSGYALLNGNGYNEVIDSNGVVVFRSKSEVFLDAGGICRFAIHRNKWGLFDCKGSRAIGELKCSKLTGFSEGFSAFTRKGREGFIQQNGDVVIPAIFLGARSFHEGKAAVLSAHDGWKYIDAAGEVVVEGQFVQATDYSEGYAAVVLPNAEQLQSDTTLVEGGLGERVIAINKFVTPMWALIDSNGTLVEGAQHGMVFPPMNGVFSACDNGLCQAISIRTGLRVIPGAYHGSIVTTKEFIICHDDRLLKVDVYDYNGLLISSMEGVLGLDVSPQGVIRVSSDCENGDLQYGLRPCAFKYFTGQKWVP